MSCAVWTRSMWSCTQRSWSLDDVFAPDDPAVLSLPFRRFTAAHWLHDYQEEALRGLRRSQRSMMTGRLLTGRRTAAGVRGEEQQRLHGGWWGPQVNRCSRKGGKSENLWRERGNTKSQDPPPLHHKLLSLFVNGLMPSVPSVSRPFRETVARLANLLAADEPEVHLAPAPGEGSALLATFYSVCARYGPSASWHSRWSDRRRWQAWRRWRRRSSHPH